MGAFKYLCDDEKCKQRGFFLDVRCAVSEQSFLGLVVSAWSVVGFHFSVNFSDNYSEGF